jgi:hypothetical protein
MKGNISYESRNTENNMNQETRKIKIVKTYAELLTVCEIASSNHEPVDIILNFNVWLEKNGDSNYRIAPPHCQRNESNTSEVLLQFENAGKWNDGISEFKIVVPTSSIQITDPTTENVTFQYETDRPYSLDGNRRRDVLSNNPPESWIPKTIKVSIIPLDSVEEIENYYALIDNEGNSMKPKDEVYSAYRASNIHKNVNGYIATGSISKSLQYISADGKNYLVNQTVSEYKDEIVMLSNMINYDKKWSPIASSKNANRPCFIAACLLLLKYHNRSNDIKETLKLIIEEGKSLYDQTNATKKSSWRDYWTPVFDRFGETLNRAQDGKIKLSNFLMTPIERILWEVFAMPEIRKTWSDKAIASLTYFGVSEAGYQFIGPSKSTSFFIYMIEKAMEEGNKPYLTETIKKNDMGKKIYVDIFGGQKTSKKTIPAPHNRLLNLLWPNKNTPQQGVVKFATKVA